MEQIQYKTYSVLSNVNHRTMEPLDTKGTLEGIWEGGRGNLFLNLPSHRGAIFENNAK